jgi:hypothetical protein
MLLAVIKEGICEYCNIEQKWLASNSFHGFYCIDCIRLSRNEDAECLKEIKKAISENNKNKGTGIYNPRCTTEYNLSELIIRIKQKLSYIKLSKDIESKVGFKISPKMLNSYVTGITKACTHTTLCYLLEYEKLLDFGSFYIPFIPNSHNQENEYNLSELITNIKKDKTYKELVKDIELKMGYKINCFVIRKYKIGKIRKCSNETLKILEEYSKIHVK